MITFADEIIENHIEQDLFNVFRDREEYPDERIEAMAEMISDLAAQDAADAARAIGDSSGQGQTAWYIAGALYDLYAFLEAGVEHERRKALREYFWPGGPQPGPARGAPTGQPGPQGWIIGRPGGNGSSRGGEVVTVTGGGCVTISYDQNNNPIITIAPCK
jgi:hypothetical protein